MYIYVIIMQHVILFWIQITFKIIFITKKRKIFCVYFLPFSTIDGHYAICIHNRVRKQKRQAIKKQSFLK